MDGYALSGPNFFVEVVGERGYRGQLDAIGGALQVVSRMGEGTTVEGQIPAPSTR